LLLTFAQLPLESLVNTVGGRNVKRNPVAPATVIIFYLEDWRTKNPNPTSAEINLSQAKIGLDNGVHLNSPAHLCLSAKEFLGDDSGPTQNCTQSELKALTAQPGRRSPCPKLPLLSIGERRKSQSNKTTWHASVARRILPAGAGGEGVARAGKYIQIYCVPNNEHTKEADFPWPAGV
jgi:hypothetical protein